MITFSAISSSIFRSPLFFLRLSRCSYLCIIRLLYLFAFEWRDDGFERENAIWSEKSQFCDLYEASGIMHSFAIEGKPPNHNQTLTSIGYESEELESNTQTQLKSEHWMGTFDKRQTICSWNSPVLSRCFSAVNGHLPTDRRREETSHFLNSGFIKSRMALGLSFITSRKFLFVNNSPRMIWFEIMNYRIVILPVLWISDASHKFEFKSLMVICLFSHCESFIDGL
jgi:hypothetical protein